MSTNIDSKINEARSKFEEAFHAEAISQRNKFFLEGLKNFKEIQNSELNKEQKNKISNIKIAYGRQLLKNLNPTPSVWDDIMTYYIIRILTKKNSNFLESKPKLKHNLIDFKESLERSHEYHQLINYLKNKSDD